MKAAVRTTLETAALKLTDVQLGAALTTVEVQNEGTRLGVLIAGSVLLLVDGAGTVTVERQEGKERLYLTEHAVTGVLEYRAEYPFAGSGRRMRKLETGLGKLLGGAT